jgi:hypothetical protein
MRGGWRSSLQLLELQRNIPTGHGHLFPFFLQKRALRPRPLRQALVVSLVVAHATGDYTLLFGRFRRNMGFVSHPRLLVP